MSKSGRRFAVSSRMIPRDKRKSVCAEVMHQQAQDRRQKTIQHDNSGGRRMTSDVSRRSLLALGAGLTTSALLGDVAQAKAPKLGPQPQYFYRFNVGGAEVTVVSDGALALGDPKGTFTGVPDDEMRKILTDHCLAPTSVVLEQNSPIVNLGDKFVLFDTGMGTSKMFGPTTGRQQKSMKDAGIKPEDIDAVVFSHG